MSPQQLQNKIDAALRRLESLKAELARCQDGCQHRWSEPAGSLVLDMRPGTGGVVTRRTVTHWTWQCKICGKIAHTTSPEVRNEKPLKPEASPPLSLPDPSTE